jgi:GTPase SAR1 family protein
MWADNETNEDLLGFQVHADLIRSVVLNPKLLPVTIGVFGDWGSGKSSIMEMLKRDLEPESQQDPKIKAQLETVAVLHFNGWLFEGYDDAKSALLSSIVSQLAEHKRFGPKIRDSAKNLLHRVRGMRLLRWGVKEIGVPALKAYLTGGLSLAGDLTGHLTKLATKKSEEGKEKEKDSDSILAPEEDANTTDVRAFRKEFEEMLRKSDIKTLVVLIDDLDRCSPERIIENLEAIKLFLNAPCTAFVIGADPRIVRHAIAVRYKDIRKDDIQALTGDLELNERLVDDYLEKLIQIPYNLPRLSRAEIETYMTLLLCKRELEEAPFGTCLKAWKDGWVRNRYASFSYASVKESLRESFPAQLEAPLTLCAGTASMVAEGLNGNPRQVKRFLNAFLLRKQLAEASKIGDLRDDVLMKLMLLEYYKLPKFRELFKWQSEEKGHPKALAVLEKWAKAAPEEKSTHAEGLPVDKTWQEDSRLQQWLAIEPALTDVDLSDYFWLARDRLQSTLGNLSLIPPIVRRFYESLLKDGPRRAAATQVKTQLQPAELDMLHGCLSQHLLRKPDDRAAHAAFNQLIQAGVASAQAYSEVLLKLPVEKVPPATSVTIDTLVKQYPAIAPTFAKVIERIGAADKTRTGRAISEQKKR